jgi:hypothetical protein
MGTIPAPLVRSLKRRLGLVRAVETGTWVGGGALLLADAFDDVTTIELSPEVAARAREILAREPVTVLEGDSRTLLRPSMEPTFYFLDAHWCGGITGGAEAECPVLQELDAIAGGSPDDVIVIDDAKLFVEPPPPPHRAEDWPTLAEVEERIARHWPGHGVTVAHDQIVAVPARAADLIADWSSQPFVPPQRDRNPVRRALRRVKRLARRGPARTRPARRARG